MEMQKDRIVVGTGTVKQTEHNQNQYKEETLKNSEENQDKTFVNQFGYLKMIEFLDIYGFCEHFHPNVWIK